MQRVYLYPHPSHFCGSTVITKANVKIQCLFGMEKSGADIESRPWLRVFGKCACGERLGNQRSRCLLEECIGGEWRDEVGRWARLWPFLSGQRQLYASAKNPSHSHDHCLPLENIWEIYPCSCYLSLQLYAHTVLTVTLK